MSIKAKSRTAVLLRGDNLSLSTSCIWVERDNFYGANESRKRKKGKDRKPNPERFLIIGFDTEYKTTGEFTREELQAGLGHNEILSYQVRCKIDDPEQPDAKEWGGICFPEGSGVENRLTLADLLTFAIWNGIVTFWKASRDHSKL